MPTKENRKIVLLSGGTGTPKLILGLREFIYDESLTIIGNTGDDDEFYGLLVSPDIDTLIYLFAGTLDLGKFWGLENESFNVLNQLAKMKENTWFQLGDKDLGLHLLRNKLLNSGLNVTDIISEICDRLGIKSKIIPMSNDSVRTALYDSHGTKYSFQSYTVETKEKPVIIKVEYEGSEKATITPELRKTITNTSTIIIGPSNPITSIGPMLAIKELKDAMIKTRAIIIAVSPFKGETAFSGPAAKLMTKLKHEANAYGVAKMYKDFLDIIVISEEDKKLIPKIAKLGIRAICANISLKTPQERKDLAEKILNVIDDNKKAI